jgi:hypothetical protein
MDCLKCSKFAQDKINLKDVENSIFSLRSKMDKKELSTLEQINIIDHIKQQLDFIRDEIERQ